MLGRQKAIFISWWVQISLVLRQSLLPLMTDCNKIRNGGIRRILKNSGRQAYKDLFLRVLWRWSLMRSAKRRPVSPIIYKWLH